MPHVAPSARVALIIKVAMGRHSMGTCAGGVGPFVAGVCSGITNELLGTSCGTYGDGREQHEIVFRVGRDGHQRSIS